MEQHLSYKILKASDLMLSVLTKYKNPVVMSSFGKDSMVMLDILKKLGQKLPILFHKEPFEPTKYEFANSVIQEEGYTVYDYPPSLTTIIKNNGVTEIVSYYQAGPPNGESTAYTYVPTGIKPYEEGESFLCGYEDIYSKPLGSFNFPWDVCFVGHKSSDIDPVIGKVPLLVDIKQTVGGADYAFPLRYFTDENIWEYTEKYKVAYNKKRYRDGKELSDISHNPDYFRACTRCMDKDEGEVVFCPKLQSEISNIASSLRYEKTVPKPAYIGVE